MPLLPRFLRRFFQRGTSPSPHSERVGPLTEAVKQVSVFKEAVRTNDKQMLLELFSISEDDDHINEFIEVHQGIELHIESAVYTRKGEIEVQLRFSDKNSMKKTKRNWLLTPDSGSPTGWKVRKVCRGALQLFFRKCT